MKLIRLRSIANQAVRETMWTQWYTGDWPYKHFTTKDEYTVDLLTGTVTPNREGDDLERFYLAMSKWFLQVLEKEKIPVDVIESAKIVADLPESYTCVIKAGGKTFESFEKRKRKQEKKK